MKNWTAGQNFQPIYEIFGVKKSLQPLNIYKANSFRNDKFLAKIQYGTPKYFVNINTSQLFWKFKKICLTHGLKKCKV